MSKEPRTDTTLRLKRSTLGKLYALKSRQDTYDDIILRLIKNAK